MPTFPDFFLDIFDFFAFFPVFRFLQFSGICHIFRLLYRPLLHHIFLGRISAGTFPAGLSPSEAAAAGGVQEMTKVWVGWVMGITPARRARSCSSNPPGERQRVSRRKEVPEGCSGTLTKACRRRAWPEASPDRAAGSLASDPAPAGAP